MYVTQEGLQSLEKKGQAKEAQEWSNRNKHTHTLPVYIYIWMFRQLPQQLRNFEGEKTKKDVDAQSNNLVDREEIYGRIAFI